MNLRLVALPCVLFLFTGCGDSLNSLAQEYRNLNHEGVDALMMVTSEAAAERMTIRVFKPMKDRYENVDDRLLKLYLNRTSDAEFMTDMVSADGVHLYLTEFQANRERLTLEMLRVKRLANDIMDKKRAEDPDAKVEESIPFLHNLAKESGILNPLRMSLKNPKLITDYLSMFTNMRKPKDYDKNYKMFEDKRRSLTFQPSGIKLVN